MNENKLSTLGSRFSLIDEINNIDFDPSIKLFLIKSKTLLGFVEGFDERKSGEVVGE